VNDSKPILLVEDDRVDAMTTERAFKELNIQNRLLHTVNGERALQYLKSRGNEKPAIILLDLNMPRMSGIEFLEAVKADEALRKIPVVVLTTSGEQQDIEKSFRQSAAGYIVKPADYKKFLDAVDTIIRYWRLSELTNGG
jgi:CheY-like chemotaxis protein